MKKLVFDVGASYIKYALMDDEAFIVLKGQVKTPQDGLDSFLNVLKEIYLQYENQINGIAMSVPGIIDSSCGQIYAPGGLHYNENVNLVDCVHQFTNLPVTLENDGKCAALAELWKGNLKDYQDGVVIVVGSALGGGIVKDKKLWKGQHLFAGEFSYIWQGNIEYFEKRSWASMGSTSALIEETAKRKHISCKELDGKRIFEMIDSGDEDAIKALEMITKELAKGIYNLQCIIDPQKILIGGGISQQPLFIQKIQDALDVIYSKFHYDIPRVQIETCRFYNDSNLIGALYHYQCMQSYIEGN